MMDLAEKYNKTIAQIALRWHIQKGIIPIPKSSHYGRMTDNIDVFNFQLSEEDIRKIDKLDRNERVSYTPSNTTYDDFKWWIKVFIFRKKLKGDFKIKVLLLNIIAFIDSMERCIGGWLILWK